MAAAAELLGNAADVETGQPRPQDEVDVGRADQEHRADHDLEDLHPAVDHECRLLVVAVDLEHRQRDRHPGDVDHFGGLDHAVEEFELLGLQHLEDPAPDPCQQRALFEQPGRGAQVVGGGLPVGQTAGVLVDAHEHQTRLVDGRLQAALAIEIGDDRAGGADRSDDRLGGVEPVDFFFQVMVDESDRAAAGGDQAEDLAEPGRAAGVHHHGVLDRLDPGAPQFGLGVRELRLGEKAAHRHLLRPWEHDLVVREQTHRTHRRRKGVEISREVRRDDLHASIVLNPRTFWGLSFVVWAPRPHCAAGTAAPQCAPRAAVWLWGTRPVVAQASRLRVQPGRLHHKTPMTSFLGLDPDSLGCIARECPP